MNSYGPLADCYDGLTWDVDYSSWADYLERHFARNRKFTRCWIWDAEPEV